MSPVYQTINTRAPPRDILDMSSKPPVRTTSSRQYPLQLKPVDLLSRSASLLIGYLSTLLTSHRSSGSDSLSIHTHGIRGLDLNVGDPRATAYGGSASLKIAAGERFRDIYAFAAERNVTVVGGADTGVGIAGWVAYGGHSPVSGHYGMGADQVLEMEVVTADGVLRTVNEHDDPDLFWALRGVSPLLLIEFCCF
jgi:hypothetical protein